MKIAAVRVYQMDLPYVGGVYAWGPGRSLDVARTTVVVLETDSGLEGCGESCPLGATYLAAHAPGILAAAPTLARAVIGLDPLQTGAVEQAMDTALKGHGYAKSAFDAACWDLLGKAAGLPVSTLLGGRLTDGAPMYRVVPQKSLEATLEEMASHRQAGYRQFQIKVGQDPDGDIERIRSVAGLLRPGETAFADANTGWSVRDAVRVVRAVRDLDVIIEQPCLTYDECLQVRSRCDHPMKLDECVTGLDVAAHIVADRSAEVVCLKISNLGGLSKARRARDFLVAHGIEVVCEDTWGGEICSAACAHFAASTPAAFQLSTTDLHNYNTTASGTPPPRVAEGRLFASDTPGLGVEPDYSSLGRPVAIFP